MTWPLVQRNKVLDSKILDTLDACIGSPPDERCKELAEQLKAKWESLDIAYRIPKRKIDVRLVSHLASWFLI